MKLGTFTLALGATLVPAGLVQAATLSGLTFAVGSAAGLPGLGTHFHAGTAGAEITEARAEVGNLEVRFGTEEIRGLSEFDLSGVGEVASASLGFGVFAEKGLYDNNDFAYRGPIDIYSYRGDGVATLADYSAAETGLVGSFSTEGLAAGETLGFDVTAALNAALDAGEDSLGFRLQIAGEGNGGAFTFEDFQIVTTETGGPTDPTDPTDPTGPSPVPLPASALLLLGAVAGLGGMRRRKG